MMSFHHMSPNAKQITDLSMYGEKPLGLPNGFEFSHQSFPLARWLMRYSCTVVCIVIRVMGVVCLNCI
jgi:hypothetical protein